MNEDIKSAAKKAGVPLFRIGYSMGISESALSRKLRGQLNDKEKEAIYLAIKHAQFAADMASMISIIICIPETTSCTICLQKGG